MLRARSRLHAYTFAVAAVLAAVTGRLLLDAWVSPAVPFLPFFLAVIAAAWYGGVGPGLVTTAATTAAAYWLIPADRLGLDSSGAIGVLGRFAAVASLVSWLIDRLQHAQALAAERLASEYESLRRAEVALLHLAAIVESSDDAIIGTNLDGVITSWNGGAERLFGYTAAEAVDRSIRMIIAPDRLAEGEQVLARIRSGQRTDHFETSRLRKDGSLVEVSVTVSPIKDAAGTTIGASKIARDITDRRRVDRMRDELLERERRALADAMAARDRLGFLAEVSALVSSSLDYQETLDRAVHLALPRLGDYCTVLVEDDAGRLRPLASAHVVPAKEAALHDLVRRLVDPPEAQQIPTFSRVVMTTARPLVADHATILKTVARIADMNPDAGALLNLGEQVRPYAYIGVPLLVRGRAVGVMSFGTGAEESAREYSESDVVLIEEFARRVSLAIENARLFQKADELNRLKDEFLATLSHELRTPLTAVLGWSRLLVNGQLAADQTAHALRVIERSAQAQTQIVDDILDVARGMTGNLRLTIAPVDVVAVTHRAIEAIAPAAAAKQIDVKVHAPTAVTVIGDAGRLQQVVWNVLSNAVKFTDANGQIAIEIAVRNGRAELVVTDTGMGIPPTFLPYVFEKFRQADGSFKRQHGGLGLGLAIARHLVELHGGSIEARSDGEGSGATFLISLPESTAPAGAMTI